MSGIDKSEEGARLVEARYRELLARWPIHCEQRHVWSMFQLAGQDVRRRLRTGVGAARGAVAAGI
jgi:hypothetical protein